VKVLCIGVHPDDCEIGFGGTAAKFAGLGDQVKFLCVTNGSAGHHQLSRDETAAIRKTEAKKAGERLEISEVEILSNPDGELTPTLDVRHEIIRQIRRWKADLVLTHRPGDYHPDHRYTSQLVQDSAYLVMVPSVCPDTEPLRRNPVFAYLQDDFHLPAPFAPEIAVDIGDAWAQKLDALDAHASQFYEWLPWIDGNLERVPEDSAARRQWLGNRFSRPVGRCVEAALARRYGSGRADEILHVEAFQVCEYGRRPSPDELDQMFPR